jgi:subtilisin family serine protease
MAKRATKSSGRPEAVSGPTPRLGVVIRFPPKAAATAIRQLESGGFRVASSRDFKTAAAVPNDFDGADVQYFERFGIAIVRREEGRLKPVLEKAMAQNIVSAVRPERAYRALGEPSRAAEAVAVSELLGSAPSTLDRDYLRGYRDATVHLIDRLLTGEPDQWARAAARFDESVVTWGLEATLVPLSQLTGAGIKVAVLDTGFDDSHPDFRGRLVTKKLFASRSSTDDVHGHGTHCIGTACGPLRPAGVPRYGIAHEAHIFAGKVLGDDGFGTDRSIIAGMDWAVEEGCQVISMSLGAATAVGDQPNDDYEQIGQVCLDAGVIVIAAAGNESDRPRLIAPVGSPANASTIMAVGAIDRSFLVARFSCGGVNPGQEVDIAAPGVDVLSSVPGGRHARFQGTSMATPHVAGVAALLAQSDEKFRGWALWARLLQLVRPLGAPARDVGKGLLQAPRS